MIKRIKLFVNRNEQSKELANRIMSLAEAYGLEPVEEKQDLSIAIGGDGSFLRMVHANGFDTSGYYVGVNTGTLGFLQEIQGDEIEAFLSYLQEGAYRIEQLDIQQTEVVSDKETRSFLSLNETVIRRADLGAVDMDIHVGSHLLEHFSGDGILVSTSVGSTAYNMSFQGSIVDPCLKTMQITPIAPLTNKRYHNLMSSVVIPDYKKIRLEVFGKDLIVSTDGANHTVKQVREVKISILPETIRCLKFHDYGFAKKIYKKLLMDEQETNR